MAALSRPGQTAFQSVRVVLAMGAVAAAVRVRPPQHSASGRRAWGRSFYTPLIVVVAAGVLIVSWLHPSAFLCHGGLPAQIVACIAVLAASGLCNWDIARRPGEAVCSILADARARPADRGRLGRHALNLRSGRRRRRTVDVAAARSTIPAPATYRSTSSGQGRNSRPWTNARAWPCGGFAVTGR